MYAPVSARWPSPPETTIHAPTRLSELARGNNDPVLGDRLVVGLRTLTPSAGVRIPLPQPDTKKPAQAGFFVSGWGRGSIRTRSSNRAARGRCAGRRPEQPGAKRRARRAAAQSIPSKTPNTIEARIAAPAQAGFFVSDWGRGSIRTRSSNRAARGRCAGRRPEQPEGQAAAGIGSLYGLRFTVYGLSKIMSPEP